MATNKALVKFTPNNGNHLVAPALPAPKALKQLGPVEPLTNELVNQILAGRGMRGWLRAAKVARVLGLLSLYLFLDTYDIRADFNRRTFRRLKEKASQLGRAAQFKTWLRGVAYETLDRLIRSLRYLVFRG